MKRSRCLPHIRKEIRGLKKVKGDFGEIDTINKQLEEQKVEIKSHLVQIDKYEKVLDYARNDQQAVLKVV